MHIALMILYVAMLQAQTAPDPSGHWEGSVQIPGREMNFEVDLAKNSKGQFNGTIGVPAQNEKGVPLMNIVVDGTNITFGRSDQPFHGVIAADGKSIFGDYTISGFVLPFTLSRTGEAHIEPAPKNRAVSKEFEGTWNGTLQTSTSKLRFVLKMSNQRDGNSMATLLSLDEGGLELPAAMTQEGRSLKLTFKSVGSSYSGDLNAEGTELSGTFSQGTFSRSLTFRRESN
jgi:hypothetical protein